MYFCLFYILNDIKICIIYIVIVLKFIYYMLYLLLLYVTKSNFLSYNYLHYLYTITLCTSFTTSTYIIIYINNYYNAPHLLVLHYYYIL